MELENEQNGKKKWIYIAVGILILILVVIFSLLTFGKDSTITKQIGNILPFGDLGTDSTRGITGSNNNGGGDQDGNILDDNEKPLFLQLAKDPVAGAINVVRDGKTYVRYVLRENGFVFEVDPETAVSKQLTNTTIPRVYEASFGNEGNSVVLRYLKRDTLSRIDVIKTYLANLELPTDSADPVAVGTLRGEYLPDNISALSISPDSKNLFYLLPISEGVSGTMVSLTNTQPPKEILRNAFSEWLPQLLNNGKVLLTTKASVKVPGYAYLYNPKDKSLERVVREKNGLTTQVNANGTYVLFSENIGNTPTVGIQKMGGFSSDESPIPLTTLPEKCAGAIIHDTLYCGSFQSTGNINLPDEWYQGLISLNDTFWSIDTLTQEINIIADPMESIQRNFDVTMPFIDNKETYFFFVDKNDSSLWSMRIPALLNPDENITPSIDPSLSPEEQKDALGSTTN